MRICLAAWRLYELLTERGNAAQLVEQLTWYENEENDLNDILKADGAETVRARLEDIEPWAIPRFPGRAAPGRGRVLLPSQDWAQYWRFRCKADFTRWVKKLATEDGESDEMMDVCGFRVAALSRVVIAGYLATLTGEDDHRPRVLFSAAIQAPRHGPNLIRRVFTDDELHSLTKWARFGPIWEPKQFSRLITILERGAHLGAKEVANFVGLCWLNGRLIVNEGKDAHFENPKQQCTYHDLVFPSGPVGHAVTVIRAYQRTFGKIAAALLLVWGLGAHLKALLGFWPHMVLESQKGAGTTTLTKRLERTIGMKMFSRQTLDSPFRVLCALSGTSHPFGFEEISAGKTKIIDKMISDLQMAYQFNVTERNSELQEHIVAAPVLLAGEDVPVRPLLGKVVRAQLETGQRGALIAEDLPVFPVRPWLEFLTGCKRETVQALHAEACAKLHERCRAPDEDPGAQRMVVNYAALAVAWRLLAEFAGIPPGEGGFLNDLGAELNAHLTETDADREPWVWIVEILLSEIDARQFRHPYKFDLVFDENDEPHQCLIVRAGHVMDHIAHSSHLRDRWDALSVKSPRAFKRQIMASACVIDEETERAVGGRRLAHALAISVQRLEEFGLYASYDEDSGLRQRE